MNNKIDYKKEWKKLKDRIKIASISFNYNGNVGKYASGVLQGVLEYMNKVDNENGGEN